MSRSLVRNQEVARSILMRSTNLQTERFLGVALGWLLLGEAVGWRLLAALALVAAGIVLINLAPVRFRKTSG